MNLYEMYPLCIVMFIKKNFVLGGLTIPITRLTKIITIIHDNDTTGYAT